MSCEPILLDLQAKPFLEVLAFLLKHKLIDGDNMTVTGLSLGENLERWTHVFGELDFRQDVIRPLDKPIKSTGHIRCACLHYATYKFRGA